MKQGDLFGGRAEERPASRPTSRPSSGPTSSSPGRAADGERPRANPSPASGDAARPAGASGTRGPRAARESDPADGAGDARDRRLAVTEFRRPILLEAGAGTGKTATLVARVLHWCLGPGWDAARAADAEADPEHVALRVLRGVAAITFTEAAAAEMSTRVGQALATVQRVAGRGALVAEELPRGLVLAALPDDPDQLARRARALRAALDHLNVSTIHAFCRRLLAAHPLAVALDPAFEVDATFAQVEICVRDVLEEHLREAWADPVDEDLIELARRGVDPPAVEAALVALIDAGARAEDFAADPLDGATCAALVETLLATFEPVRAAVDLLRGAGGNTAVAIEALDRTAELLAGAPGDRGADFGRLSAGLREIWEADARAFRRLKEWRKGKLVQKESRPLGDGVEAFVERTDAFAAALRPLLEIDAELLDRARRVVGALLGKVERELNRRGVATFADLLHGAARLLREHPEVAARERGKLRQLLVDEFQDTDQVQCDVVAALGLGGEPDENPGLFLVGDPKQSIFAWRNADLLAYDQFAARVDESSGLRLALTHNFRSRRAILDEVQRAVAPVMEERHGEQPAFVRLEPGREDAEGVPGQPARVEYWVSWPRDARGAVDPGAKRRGPSYEVEARALAADVAARAATDPALSWRDFGVVFRSFTDVEPYLDALRRRGVPYEVQSDRKYYQRREVIDATALVRAALDPNDQLALVTVLRSPLVGVPDVALLPLWKRGFPAGAARLFAADAGVLEELAAIAREVAASLPTSIPGLAAIDGWEHSLVAALRALGELRGAFRELPADAWIERLRALFLPDATEAQRYLGAYRLANLERFFRELLRALEERAGDVPSVLRTLRANLARVDRSEASRPSDSGQDAVRILTIHGAKGLEFAHVYLAQTHKHSGSRGEDRTAFDRRDGVAYRLFGAPAPAWFAAEERRRRAEAAERVRLLYVALTRARERLVVLGGWPAESGGQAAERKAWDRCQTFLDLLAHRAHASGAVAELARAAAGGDFTPHVDPAGARWWLAAEVDEDEGAAVPRDGAGRDARERGARERAREDARRLAALAADAAHRAARPYHAVASQEAHADDAERRAGRRYAEGDSLAGGPTAEGDAYVGSGGDARPGTAGETRAPVPGVSRAAAQAVGTAVHRVLEHLPLARDVRAAFEHETARLPELLRGAVAGDELEASLARAEDLCRRLASNGLLERLAALAPHVVARELAVVLPPSPGAPTGAVAFVSGAIDLLYRDPETGALVVADYKTDPLESPDELDARAARYAPQGRAYVEAVRAALSLDEPPRFELWFLHSGDVVAVS